ncbi:DMT family transporter [Psychrobium sp. 1_MG-2023]|uniref:DMT family transporter n=1 Tax=Psychrobium sp. 1_MG-2023 TaxID=3062624 RepID=UPI000C33FDB3|nr:DMT family transporter [Psychrobium sp. 1_MG-2023]MDP2562878.1 DMT family transporter [Psychrobium sp. 1_MG-2023]PKF57207.1 EamA family transporter [Alteromonadales bacterium alter-6D02]
MSELRPALVKIIPVIFVLLWSTGFIGAKYALPYIEPFNLLFIRMLITVAVFLCLMKVLGVTWPSRNQIKHQAVSGLLIHGAYLGGVFTAIKLQMPAGITALLVSMQPLLTALITIFILQQAVKLRQWLGLSLGFVGVVLVLLAKEGGTNVEFGWPALLATLISLVGITIGSMYQKKFSGNVSLVAASLIQYSATALLMAGLTFCFETQVIDWQLPLVAALTWLVFGLSVSAALLLLYMIRQGESAKVASYFYLVPGITAIEAWLLFEEQLPFLAIMGFLISIVGVYLTIARGRASG